jgi:site-specific DNA-methyltransferase (adenine-specific)
MVAAYVWDDSERSDFEVFGSSQASSDAARRAGPRSFAATPAVLGAPLYPALYNGDCLDVMATLPAASVDMILCDLPYGTTACSWDAVIPFPDLWAQYLRLAKPNAPIILTASQPFTYEVIASNRKMFRYEMIWKKSRITGFQLAKKMPMKAHENVLVFYRSLPTYNPQGLVAINKVKSRKAGGEGEGLRGRTNSLIGDYVQEFTGYPNSILEFQSVNSTVHPTQKPVALMEYLIRTYTHGGGYCFG